MMASADRRPRVVRADAWTGGAPFHGHIQGNDFGGEITVLYGKFYGLGAGPPLHFHPYEEVFLLQSGRARFTVGDDTLEAAGGDLVLAPAHVPHKFENLGPGPLVSIDIHMSPEWIQTNLEEKDG
ncbi:MAG: cupin domain-containing protein [Pseudomonadota bacterium]